MFWETATTPVLVKHSGLMFIVEHVKFTSRTPPYVNWSECWHRLAPAQPPSLGVRALFYDCPSCSTPRPGFWRRTHATEPAQQCPHKALISSPSHFQAALYGTSPESPSIV